MGVETSSAINKVEKIIIKEQNMSSNEEQQLAQTGTVTYVELTEKESIQEHKEYIESHTSLSDSRSDNEKSQYEHEDVKTGRVEDYNFKPDGGNSGQKT